MLTCLCFKLCTFLSEKSFFMYCSWRIRKHKKCVLQLFRLLVCHSAVERYNKSFLSPPRIETQAHFSWEQKVTHILLSNLGIICICLEKSDFNSWQQGVVLKLKHLLYPQLFHWNKVFTKDRNPTTNAKISLFIILNEIVNINIINKYKLSGTKTITKLKLWEAERTLNIFQFKKITFRLLWKEPQGSLYFFQKLWWLICRNNIMTNQWAEAKPRPRAFG